MQCRQMTSFFFSSYIFIQSPEAATKVALSDEIHYTLVRLLASLLRKCLLLCSC